MYVIGNDEPELLCRFSDCATGYTVVESELDSIQGQEIFLFIQCSDPVSAPHRLLSNRNGVKATSAWSSPLTSIYCKDYDSVELHVNSPHISSRHCTYLITWQFYLYQSLRSPRIAMIVEYGVMVEWWLAGENRRNSERNVPKCHCWHHKIRMTSLGSERALRSQSNGTLSPSYRKLTLESPGLLYCTLVFCKIIYH
jgi:hypothetical protein